MGGGVVVPPWLGFWGSMDRKSFNTETERGPPRNKVLRFPRGAFKTSGAGESLPQRIVDPAADAVALLCHPLWPSFCLCVENRSADPERPWRG